MIGKTLKLIICLIIAISLSSAALCAEKVFYVSTKGSDSWSGAISKPSKSNTDGPFATLEKAKTAVGELNAKGISQGGVRIVIEGGVYNLKSPFKLTSEDSGSKKSPVRWASAPGDEVRFIGGQILDNFIPVKDKSVLDRFDQSCRDKIVQADISSLGISDYGSVNPKAGPRMELFYKGKFMTIARYPNAGKWLTIADVPQTGEKMINEGLDRDILRGAPIPRGRHYGRISYDDPRPEKWQASDEIWMHGFFVWDWFDGYQRIEKIDKAKKEIYPAEPHHSYGYTKGQRYYYMNVLEELDSPGEWYLDKKAGIVYFLPPEPLKKGDVSVSTLNEPMMILDGVSNISIEGIIFECGRSSGVVIKGGNDNKIAGCTLRNLGNTAVVIDGGTNNGVLSCDIYDVASGGISISGGERKTLTPGKKLRDKQSYPPFFLDSQDKLPGN